MSCLYVREEIQARETQDNKVKIFCLCAILFPLLSSEYAHTASFLFVRSLAGTGTRHQSQRPPHGGNVEPKRSVISTGRPRVHSGDLSLREQLLILLLCNGKDTVLTSYGAEHLLSGDIWRERKKKLQHQQGDTLQCKTLSRDQV